LHKTGAVTQVHKNQAAMVTARMHPSHEYDVFSDLLFTDFAAAVRSLLRFEESHPLYIS
jgi:hypothetical protein